MIKKCLTMITIIKMAIYTKRVRAPELEFYRKAEEAGIVPRIVNYVQVDDVYELSTERYSHSLWDLRKNKEDVEFILSQAKILVQKLHDIGILHGDLSEENIVYDRDTKRVALIDFGFSKYISTISNIERAVEELYEGVYFANKELTGIPYLLSVELGILDFLAKSYL
jgi:tRNA A-37 threonylcarbamoyl transferase component Bud32